MVLGFGKGPWPVASTPAGSIHTNPTFVNSCSVALSLLLFCRPETCSVCEEPLVLCVLVRISTLWLSLGFRSYGRSVLQVLCFVPNLQVLFMVLFVSFSAPRSSGESRWLACARGVPNRLLLMLFPVVSSHIWLVICRFVLVLRLARLCCGTIGCYGCLWSGFL